MKPVIGVAALGLAVALSSFGDRTIRRAAAQANDEQVRDVASMAGGVIDPVVYDSFGKVTSGTSIVIGDRFKFTGREYDAATGMHFSRARWYDPTMGRFISQDPIRFCGGDVNLYRYVANDRMNAIDPTGWLPDPPPAPAKNSKHSRLESITYEKAVKMMQNAVNNNQIGMIKDLKEIYKYQFEQAKEMSDKYKDLQATMFRQWAAEMANIHEFMITKYYEAEHVLWMAEMLRIKASYDALSKAMADYYINKLTSRPGGEAASQRAARLAGRAAVGVGRAG